jgi:hypothetical protein
MKSLLTRNLTESFTSQWISLREFQRVVFHLRTQPGSNAAGSFAVKGSNAASVASGLQADPLYAADPTDIATVTSLFSVHGDLAQPARLDATVAAHTSGLPNFVRFDYTRTGGTHGQFTLALDGAVRSLPGDRVQARTAGIPITATPAQVIDFTLPRAGVWLVQYVFTIAAVLETNRLLALTFAVNDADAVESFAIANSAAGGSTLPLSYDALSVTAASDRSGASAFLVIETNGPVTMRIDAALAADSGTMQSVVVGSLIQGPL